MSSSRDVDNRQNLVAQSKSGGTEKTYFQRFPDLTKNRLLGPQNIHEMSVIKGKNCSKCVEKGRFSACLRR